MQCDLQRPTCLRCAKLKECCPGYRDVGSISFRNENDRIIGKKLGREVSKPDGLLVDTSPSFRRGGRELSLIPSTTLGTTGTLGHDFFFATYSSIKAPFNEEYSDWVKQCSTNNRLISDAIDAVGLAGLANVSSAPQLARQAHDAYTRVSQKLHRILQTPNQETKDETLLAIILLCLFHSVSFTSWHTHSIWAELVWKGLNLIDLRGPSQFDHNRGGHLYSQIRTHVLCLCMQGYFEVPPALVNATYTFENAEIRQQWRDSDFASPVSMTVISFQLVNLRAAIKRGRVSDLAEIYEKVLTVDRDLLAWQSVLPSHWKREEPQVAGDDCDFDENQCRYPNSWLAEILNTWRVLRLACHQLLAYGSHIDGSQPASVDVIRQMSVDVCRSTAVFDDHPRESSLGFGSTILLVLLSLLVPTSVSASIPKSSSELY